MNYIKNDYDQWVIAEGAENSVARAKVQYPKLIDRLDSLYFQAYDCYGKSVDEAIEMIRAAGITNYYETDAILENTFYKKFTN